MAFLFVDKNQFWNLYQISQKLYMFILKIIVENLEAILGNLSRSTVCDIIRQTWT